MSREPSWLIWPNKLFLRTRRWTALSASSWRSRLRSTCYATVSRHSNASWKSRNTDRTALGGEPSDEERRAGADDRAEFTRALMISLLGKQQSRRRGLGMQNNG